MKKFVSASLVALLLWPATPMAADDWERRKIADYPISVEVPGTPQDSHEVSNWGPFGTAKTDGLEVKYAGAEFAANATVVPEWAIKGAGLGLIYMTTRDTFLRKHKAKVTSWDDANRAGLQGKRLRYKVNSTGRAGVMEVYVNPPFIVTFDVLLPDSAVDVEADQFFASIRMF